MLKYINQRMFLAWILSVTGTFFVVGFLGNFYSAFFEIILLTLLSQSLTGLLTYRLLGKAKHLRSSQPLDLAVNFALFLVLALFLLIMFGMAKQYPSLFDAEYFNPKNGQLIPFLTGSIFVVPCLAWGRRLVRLENVKHTILYQFMNEILTGLLLAGFFFVVYLLLASVFNQPVFDVDDIFFDSDGLLWRTRFVTDGYRDYYWRAVHPFVLLIVRPLIAMVAFFLKGDRLAAAFVLVAFAGALCVFLAWYFVKSTSGSSSYAVLIASLLGASSAHLVFGSLIETYIFLAAVAMTFMVLLLKDKPLFLLIITSVLSFGITFTNVIQTAIAYIFIKRDLIQWIKYGVIVGALVIPLTVLNNFVYPDSQPYFFIPSSFSAEAENTFNPSIARGMAILRVMFLHSIVAPDPLILKEEIPFLKVWIFKAEPMRLSEYETWFGSAIALFWMILCMLGGFFFLKNLKKADNRFSFAFILILLFNFVLHLRYGKDVFLYSTNWTYAIIFFLSLAWNEIANKRWFRIVLLIFITLLLANNSQLIFTMLDTSASHIK